MACCCCCLPVEGLLALGSADKIVTDEPSVVLRERLTLWLSGSLGSSSLPDDSEEEVESAWFGFGFGCRRFRRPPDQLFLAFGRDLGVADRAAGDASFDASFCGVSLSSSSVVTGSDMAL